MERETLIAERLLAWDSESNALAPLTESQLKSIELLFDTSDDRPFPTEVSFVISFSVLCSFIFQFNFLVQLFPI